MEMTQAYTLQQLEHLKNVRLAGFKENEPYDDMHTNSYQLFKYNCSVFLDWVKKMEDCGKISEILDTMPK